MCSVVWRLSGFWRLFWCPNTLLRDPNINSDLAVVKQRPRTRQTYFSRLESSHCWNCAIAHRAFPSAQTAPKIQQPTARSKNFRKETDGLEALKMLVKQIRWLFFAIWIQSYQKIIYPQLNCICWSLWKRPVCYIFRFHDPAIYYVHDGHYWSGYMTLEKLKYRIIYEPQNSGKLEW